MAKKTKETPKLYAGKIPWNESGALGYPQSLGGSKVVWEDNIPFEATLRATYFGRGRSSAKLNFTDANDDMHYEMFLTDVDDLIDNYGIRKGGGPIKGWWAFAKRGANYGIMYLGKENPYA
jgi:hypothetical protein